MPFNLFRKKKSEDKPLFTFPQNEPQPPASTQPQKTTEIPNTQTIDNKENITAKQPNTQETNPDPQEHTPDLPAQVSNGIDDNKPIEPQKTEPPPLAQEEKFNETLETTKKPQDPDLPVPQEEPPATETHNVEPPAEKTETPTPAEFLSKTYLKAMPLKDLADTEKVKAEVSDGNIIILRVTPLAGKNIEDVKKAVNELFEFAESSGGDIARLGEERVVVCPKNIRIWREKTPAPVTSEPLPTAA